MSPWGWSPERTQGIWRYGPLALRPFVAAAPWITLILLLMTLWFVGGTLVSQEGVLVDLPETAVGEGEATGAVALIVPSTTARKTMVFFDNSRYSMDDAGNVSTLADHISETAQHTKRKTILVLADRRVPGGELMRFAALARKNGITKILFAEKRAGSDE